MRLKAKEDYIYKLMDKRDLYLLGIGICGITIGISLYLLTSHIRWDFLYLFAAFIFVMIFLIIQTVHINRRIMEAGQCYLQLADDCLITYQPEKNGHYESCRIYYCEMEKIVEGSRRGVPEFYVVIKNDEHRKSFILLDDEEEERLIFCVRSLGYGTEEFREFYKKLKWEVPGKVRIVGTKHQETWNLKQSYAGLCLAAGIAIIYIIPKIIEVMGFF